ncbi:putative lipoprotein [Bacillus anthracis]|nr:putative lipoprotein [Bacillus anthracis]
MQQCGLKKTEKEKSGNEAKSYKEMAEKMDHGATALKDGKYLEAKDIANEVLQMKKDDALETAVTSNAENNASKSKRCRKESE